MRQLLEHLDSGGKIVNKLGYTLQKAGNNSGYIFETPNALRKYEEACVVMDIILNSDWFILVEDYEDGIYQAESIHNEDDVFVLERLNGRWFTVHKSGKSYAEISGYKDIKRIGNSLSDMANKTPAEPTVAEKIADYPNDFIPDWTDKDQPKYYIVWRSYCKRNVVFTAYEIKSYGDTYFRTKEEAQQVIDEVLS